MKHRAQVRPRDIGSRPGPESRAAVSYETAMKPPSIKRSLLSAAFIAALAASAASAASAAEPRPWLCRDKPVFSSDRAVTYEATAGKGRRWRLFFMQFAPDGPNDGFSIVQSRDLPAGARASSGHLPPGRYYAVALHHSARGYWVCPGSVRERKDSQLGLIASLCFDEASSGCRVRLTVKPDQTAAAP